MVYELSRKEMFWSMKTEKLVSKVMENITEENPTLNKSEKNWGWNQKWEKPKRCWFKPTENNKKFESLPSIISCSCLEETRKKAKIMKLPGKKLNGA